MRTEYLTLDGEPGDVARIAHAATLLRAGALVAFPTETVYGLGADARNAEALQRLAKVKGRKEGRPFSLLVPSLRDAEEAAGGFGRVTQKLARVYWPGPLTLVVPRNGGSIGLRLSEHPVARALIAHCAFPLATPSASRLGAPEPVSARQVYEALDGEVALVLDGGPAWQGRPSTVVRVDGDTVQIQREGNISGVEILEVACPTVLFVCTGNSCRSPMAAGFLQAAENEHPGDDGLPVRILSAGINTVEGELADKLAIEAMRQVNVDISRHRTRALTFAMLDSADWIFTMTRDQRECILALMPSCEDRVQLLSKHDEDIPDPHACVLELYRQTRDKIASCLRDVVRVVGGKRA